MSKLFAVIALVLLFAGNANAAGYTARACGFDMDDDGIYGEAGDEGCTGATVTAGTCTPGDCNVCDGVTTDPDGDGEDEDLIYVDCNSGNDSTGTGSASTPYLTLSKALLLNDGAGDGREDIICVRATCNGTGGSAVSGVTVNEAGVTGKGPSELSYRTEAASGNDGWAFRYPADPFMIVGWDTDNDEEYPPYDSGQSEPAIFDACNTPGCTTANHATFIAFGSASHVELAHFTVKNYGRGMTNTTAYAFLFGNLGGDSYHHFLHDIVLDSILRGVEDADQRRVVGFNANDATAGWVYTALENIQWKNTSAWPLRGWNIGGEYLRIRDSELNEPVAYSASGNVLPMKLWQVHHLEFVDNAFIGGALTATTSQTSGIMLDGDTTDVHIAGNSFTNYSNAIELNMRLPTAYGNHGPTYVGRNRFTASDDETDLGESASFLLAHASHFNGQERTECNSGCVTSTGAEVMCENDPTSNTTPLGWGIDCDCDRADHSYHDDLTVDSNIVDFNDLTDVRSFVTYQNGSNCASEANAGPLTISNNTVLNFNPSGGTCDTTASVNCRGAIIVGMTPKKFNFDYRYAPGKVFIHNNIITGIDNDYAIINWKRGDDNLNPINLQTHYIPSTDFFANNNIYKGSTIKFIQGGSFYTGFDSWNKAVGGQEDLSRSETAASSCPAFDADGYTLLEADSCALNQGNTTYCTTYDYELETRTTPCDIGADEYVELVDPCAGECVTGGDCNDGNVCTNDACSGCPTVCSHTNNTNTCDDGLYCTGADTCSGGTCSTHAGTPCPGADSDSDCSETCDEALNSCTANDPDASACDDGLYCTVTDTCSSGTCTGVTDPCAANLGDSDSDCSEACNEAADNCTSNDTDGSNCDDGLFCTEPDACSSGTCTGPALDCSSSETSCKTGTCDEGTDACISGSNKADGTECTDNVFCNGADTCSSGDCSVHAGDPCIGGPNPVCTEATDTCSTATTGQGVICEACSCKGCSFR